MRVPTGNGRQKPEVQGGNSVKENPPSVPGNLDSGYAGNVIETVAWATVQTSQSLIGDVRFPW